VRKHFLKIFPSAALPSLSGASLMVAAKTPLPAGPLSTDGDLRGEFPHCFERVSRKREKNVV